MWPVVIIIIVLLFVILNFNKKIPKIIWTYWDGPLSDMAERCIKTWSETNPDYKIVILNRENAPDVFSLKFADTPARASDFIRLSVLTKHGGIWIDATTILSGPLDWVHSGREFVAYYKEGNMTRREYPCIESWFLACVPGCPFVQMWLDEFMTMNNYNSPREYIDAAGVDLQNMSELEYLTVYVAAQKVLQTRMDPGEAWDRFRLERMEDSQQHWWNLRLLCDPKRPKPRVIKFTRYARAEIESDPSLKCAYMSHELS
jgi:hypothetical protein